MELEVLIADEADGNLFPIQFRDTGGPPHPELAAFAIPYKTVLCMDTAFQAIERAAGKGEDYGLKLIADGIRGHLTRRPELRGPIEDLELLREESELIDLLKLYLISPAERENHLYKFSRPFEFRPIYLSPALEKLMHNQGACYTLGGELEEAYRDHLVVVGSTILRQCYGVKVEPRVSAILTVPDPEDGLPRYYRPEVNEDFVEVQVTGNLPELSDSDIKQLLGNPRDTDMWLRLLPPEVFSFHGFHLAQLHEVTEQESIGRLKHRLISRDAVLDIERVRELAELVRINFRCPELQLGLTALDYPVERTVDHAYRIRYNLLAENIDNLADPAHADTIYGRALRSQQTLTIEDLTELPHPGAPEKRLLEMGFRSMLLAPLLSQEQYVIGLVEMASPHPGMLNAFMENKFEEIRGLFRTAVERSREYINNRVEIIMREQYTSLHPAVEWRFTEAAFDILQREEAGLPPQVQDITFKKVYPLYGQADIVGSSHLRNAAIYQDLIDNLRAGRLLLDQALVLLDFPLIEQTLMTLDGHLRIELDDFDNADELRISDFIHRRLTPLIKQIGRQLPELREGTDRYLQDLDDELGLFYRVRRDYEQSVAALNRSISRFLSARDQAAQRVVPHYFEKYKTDGVEYELYAGKSLLKDRQFSRVHLQNLRLGQLIDMCQLTRGVEELSGTLPMPLRTAQLIFAYTTPLRIRFRMDEKRFDVDGDYNVRYEILKKRIDKATIRQGTERLTQAGMVSIVFLHDSALEEYREYLEYLRRAGYVEGAVEEHVLDPLQSVNGLMALRFRVALHSGGAAGAMLPGN